MTTIAGRNARRIVDMEWALLALVCLVLAIGGIYFLGDIQRTIEDGDSMEVFYLHMSLVVIYVFVLVNGLLTLLLYNGVLEEYSICLGELCCQTVSRQTYCCQTWCAINLFSVVFGVIGLVLALMNGNIWEFVIGILPLAYRVYAIMVIMTYVAVLNPTPSVPTRPFWPPGLVLCPPRFPTCRPRLPTCPTGFHLCPTGLAEWLLTHLFTENQRRGSLRKFDQPDVE